MEKQTKLSEDTLIRLCGALLEYAQTPPWTTYIAEAEEAVGTHFADNEHAQATRRILIESVEGNLINRRANAYETLQRRHNLPLTKREFAQERSLFCHALARAAGFPLPD
ncbi:MAG: hypothetical protein IJF49_08640 [Clostridia bacterium]|nr:hypothetical protein [Clostridia bacterium]